MVRFDVFISRIIGIYHIYIVAIIYNFFSLSFCSVDKLFYTNCKPHIFFRNVNEKVELTPAQVNNVKSIGFSEVLKMNFGKFPLGIIPFLVTHVDAVNRVQCTPNKPGYLVTTDNVYDILGLPLNQGKKVINRSKKNVHTLG